MEKINFLNENHLQWEGWPICRFITHIFGDNVTVECIIYINISVLFPIAAVKNHHQLSDLTQIIFVSHQGYVPLEALGVEIFLLFLTFQSSVCLHSLDSGHPFHLKRASLQLLVSSLYLFFLTLIILPPSHKNICD